MCDVDKLTSQLLELSKQLANSSKSFKLTLKTKDVNFTFSSQDVQNPVQDGNNPGAKTTATRKKKSPSQKRQDTKSAHIYVLNPEVVLHYLDQVEQVKYFCVTPE